MVFNLYVFLCNCKNPRGSGMSVILSLMFLSAAAAACKTRACAGVSLLQLSRHSHYKDYLINYHLIFITVQ